MDPIDQPKIGDPVAYRGVVGRISDIQGGVITLMTPGQTVIAVRWALTERPDLDRLREQETHPDLSGPPYGGRADLLAAMAGDSDIGCLQG